MLSSRVRVTKALSSDVLSHCSNYIRNVKYKKSQNIPVNKECRKVSWEVLLWKLMFLTSSRNDVQATYFWLTEIFRLLQVEVILYMHRRHCINKRLNACIWWLNWYLAWGYMTVYTLIGLALAEEKKRHWRMLQINTSQDMCCLSCDNAQPQYHRASFPSFPCWHWDLGCSHPWSPILPRAIQPGNGNVTALFFSILLYQMCRWCLLYTVRPVLQPG